MEVVGGNIEGNLSIPTEPQFTMSEVHRHPGGQLASDKWNQKAVRTNQAVEVIMLPRTNNTIENLESWMNKIFFNLCMSQIAIFPNGNPNMHNTICNMHF